MIDLFCLQLHQKVQPSNLHQILPTICEQRQGISRCPAQTSLLKLRALAAPLLSSLAEPGWVLEARVWQSVDGCSEAARALAVPGAGAVELDCWRKRFNVRLRYF